MAREMPSYVVRNLVDVALERTGSEGNLKKETKRDQRLVPVPHDISKTTTSEDVKALLKLHKRFEEEAWRKCHKGITKTMKQNNQSCSQNNPTIAQHQKTTNNELYFKDIFSKLDQPPSPDFPALPSNGCHPRQLVWPHGNSSDVLALAYENNSTKDCPETNVTAHPSMCAKGCHENETFPRNSSPSCDNRRSQNHLDLGQHLTIIPLTLANFGAYDSLPTFHEDASR